MILSPSRRFLRLSSSIAEIELLPSFRRKSSEAPIHVKLSITTNALQHTITRSVSASSAHFNRGKDSAELHSLYHEQMKEIDLEREVIFGPSDDDASDNQDLSTLAKTYDDKLSDSVRPTRDLWDIQAREEAYEEREALFQFSDEEKSAWSNDGGIQPINASQMRIIRQAMREGSNQNHASNDVVPPSSETVQLQPFSHLNHQGDGVSMVDVGHKAVTRRTATARSSVIFPPEVLSAFQLRSGQDKEGSSSEMIGVKGPIFETAKIAGIMGAKKTSDLIPLCHPLPLDRVNIDIKLIDNRAIIECECRVTHKTGVEMEALTGASVAALTIYDMVKAVSHRVEIGSTVLVNKTGGKSDFKQIE